MHPMMHMCPASYPGEELPSVAGLSGRAATSRLGLSNAKRLVGHSEQFERLAMFIGDLDQGLSREELDDGSDRARGLTAARLAEFDDIEKIGLRLHRSSHYARAGSSMTYAVTSRGGSSSDSTSQTVMTRRVCLFSPSTATTTS